MIVFVHMFAQREYDLYFYVKRDCLLFSVNVKLVFEFSVMCEKANSVFIKGIGALFGIRLLTLHIKFQFSKSIKSLTCHIFLNLIYPLRKKISLSQIKTSSTVAYHTDVGLSRVPPHEHSWGGTRDRYNVCTYTPRTHLVERPTIVNHGVCF